MFLSDLQTKDLISIKDGRRIGRIIDAEINHEGQLIYLIIEEKKNFRKMISSQSETKVEFTKISKIGADVILVDL
jgi:YlmC/YmxH family sporulation protein